MCFYVNDMTCWNNFDMNKFQPNDNNDMMQCVTCNKSSLFALRLKILEKKKRKDKYLCEANKIFFKCSCGVRH